MRGGSVKAALDTDAIIDLCDNGSWTDRVVRHFEANQQDTLFLVAHAWDELDEQKRGEQARVNLRRLEAVCARGNQRWAYAEVHDKLSQAMSLKVALRAQVKSGFRFVLLQTDNGPEFQKYFQDMLAVRQIALRHTRVRQSNDNAHVERFNRTLQDECVSNFPLRKNVTQRRLNEYLDYYNNGRRHMGIDMRRPAELTGSLVQRS